MMQASDCTEALIIGASGAMLDRKRYEIAEAIGALCNVRQIRARSGAYFFLLRLAISAYDAMLNYPRGGRSRAA